LHGVWIPVSEFFKNILLLLRKQNLQFAFTGKFNVIKKARFKATTNLMKTISFYQFLSIVYDLIFLPFYEI